MTKLLTSTAVLLALAAPEMSRADTLPKELLGQWCVDGEFGNGVGAGFYDKGKCKKDRDDGVMTIKPNSVEYWEDACNLTSIATRTATGQYYDKSKLRSEITRCTKSGRSASVKATGGTLLCSSPTSVMVGSNTPPSLITNCRSIR